MTARTRILAAGLAAVAAALAAAVLPAPAALAAGVATRGFAALTAAAVVAVASVPLLLWRGERGRVVSAGIAVLALGAGLVAFGTGGRTLERCTASYDGRPVVIGTEWTAVGAGYAAENPGLSTDEILFDAAGVVERLWTPASVDACRTRLAGTYFLWVPCLVVCLFAVAQAVPSGPLSYVRTTPGRVPDRSGAPATLRYDVFISYRHGGRDGAFARELLAALERDGYRVAIDERDFPANASFLQEMERCVRESRFTVAVISPRYLESGHTEEEALLTKVLDMGDRKRRLIPITIEPVVLPAWLFGLVGVDWTKPDPLVEPLDRLKATLGSPMAHA